MRAARGSLEADSLKGLRATAIKAPDDAIRRQACSEEEGGRAAFQRETRGRRARARRFERKGPTGLSGFAPGGDRQTCADQRSRKDRRRRAAADGAGAIEAAIMGVSGSPAETDEPSSWQRTSVPFALAASICAQANVAVTACMTSSCATMTIIARAAERSARKRRNGTMDMPIAYCRRLETLLLRQERIHPFRIGASRRPPRDRRRCGCQSVAGGLRESRWFPTPTRRRD